MRVSVIFREAGIYLYLTVVALSTGSFVYADEETQTVIAEENPAPMASAEEASVTAVKESDAPTVSDEAMPDSDPCLVAKNERVLIKCVKGIILIGDPKDLLKGPALDGVEGLETISVDLHGHQKQLAKDLSSYFDNRDLTRYDLEQIINAIAKYYKSLNFPLVRVEIPAQDVTSGVLQLIVIESKLGEISVAGNHYQSSDRIKYWVRLDEGGPINEGVLSNELSFLNRSPFRRVDVVYSPGNQPGTTNITLAVDDRRSYRFYTGTDNTGIISTERNRWFAGFNGTAYFWKMEHLLSYQYTASYDFHRFQSHTADYTILLPWEHSFKMFGGFSAVKPNLYIATLKSGGHSYQASGRYLIPFSQTRYMTQQLGLGFDFKRTNNTFTLTGFVFNQSANVNLTQFMGSYDATYQGDSFKLNFVGELFWSPGKMVGDESNSDYQKLRPGAVNHWVYAKAGFGYLQRLPAAFALWFLARGQLSSQTLLPTEQFGIGGWDTVRGYHERELNVDNAIIGNWEIRTPPIGIAKHIPRCRSLKDALQFIAFVDYGLGTNKVPIPFEPKIQYIWGAGPGVRYTLDPYLTLRFDWGIKLHKKETFTGGSSMAHFSAIASY